MSSIVLSLHELLNICRLHTFVSEGFTSQDTAIHFSSFKHFSFNSVKLTVWLLASQEELSLHFDIVKHRPWFSFASWRCMIMRMHCKRFRWEKCKIFNMYSIFNSLLWHRTYLQRYKINRLKRCWWKWYSCYTWRGLSAISTSINAHYLNNHEYEYNFFIDFYFIL